MRLFRVGNEENFVEYKEELFKNQHMEHTLETWLENNPDAIIAESKLLIIGRQVATNLESYIDLLGLDKEGNTVVMELKRDRTPRDTLAQALEYASFIEKLEYPQLEQIFRDYIDNESESLSRYHKEYFKIENEGVSFNKNQRIVIVGYDISPQVRQTSLFLRKKSIPVTCLEMNYFKAASGEQLLSSDIVVGKELMIGNKIPSASSVKIDKKKFLDSLDRSALDVFNAVFNLADENKLSIHWGSKGFSINAKVEGEDIPMFFGYSKFSAYPQMIYTAFYNINKRVKDGDQVISAIQEKMQKTGVFVKAGEKEMKLIASEKLSATQIKDLTDIMMELANAIKKHGLSE